MQSVPQASIPIQIENSDGDIMIVESPDNHQKGNECTPDIMSVASTYTTAALCELYVNSDGAYSEGAMMMLIERLIDNTENTLNALVMLDLELQHVISLDLGTSIAAWASAEQILILYDAELLVVDEAEAKILNDIIMAYEASPKW